MMSGLSFILSLQSPQHFSLVLLMALEDSFSTDPSLVSSILHSGGPQSALSSLTSPPTGVSTRLFLDDDTTFNMYKWFDERKVFTTVCVGTHKQWIMGTQTPLRPSLRPCMCTWRRPAAKDGVVQGASPASWIDAPTWWSWSMLPFLSLPPNTMVVGVSHRACWRKRLRASIGFSCQRGNLEHVGNLLTKSIQNPRG